MIIDPHSVKGGSRHDWNHGGGSFCVKAENLLFYSCMHKFHIVACFAGLFAVQSFAQPRDLFAEFEAEATQSSEAVVSSSSAIVSSSSVKESSSSVVSSSSVAPLSSSEVVSSSSDPAAPADSSTPAVADEEAFGGKPHQRFPCRTQFQQFRTACSGYFF